LPRPAIRSISVPMIAVRHGAASEKAASKAALQRAHAERGPFHA
jgi:hypothetical protein